MVSGIYSITSKSTGKRYIGSSVDIKKRWTHHAYFLKLHKHANSYLNRHVDKYGKDDVLFEILEETELLPEREQYWADYYQAWDREKGFNISKDTARPGTTLKGVPRSEKVRNQISKSRGTTPFKCLNTKQIFVNIRECAKILDLHSAGLASHLRGNTSHINNFKFAWCDPKIDANRRKVLINRVCKHRNKDWRFERASNGGKANRGTVHTPMADVTKIALARRRCGYSVYCLELNKSWQSLKECAEELNISHKNVHCYMTRGKVYKNMYTFIKKEIGYAC